MWHVTYEGIVSCEADATIRAEDAPEALETAKALLNRLF